VARLCSTLFFDLVIQGGIGESLLRQCVSGVVLQADYIDFYSVWIVSRTVMARKFPLHPSHPERVCWGCDRYCPAASLSCGNGSSRTQHPVELLGDDWLEYGDWGFDTSDESSASPSTFEAAASS
jgi:hypothetical protein